MSHFKEVLVFHQPKSTKPELVFSSSVSLLDVVNAASSLPTPDQAKGMQHTRATLTSHQNDDAKMVYTVATIIRSDISQCKGINLQPLNVNDLSLSNSRALLPRSL